MEDLYVQKKFRDDTTFSVIVQQFSDQELILRYLNLYQRSYRRRILKEQVNYRLCSCIFTN
jgi:hypothetical protein